MSSNLMFVIGAGVLAMVYAFWKTSWIEAQDEGTDRMKSIGASIADGAMAFLKADRERPRFSPNRSVYHGVH